MKNKIAKTLFLLSLCFSIFSCSKPVEPTPTPVEPTPSQSEECINHVDTNLDGKCDVCGEFFINENEVSYEKDENGFYILEDGYFNDKNHYLDNTFIGEEVIEQPHYESLKMYIDDKSIPLYKVKTNFSQNWNGNTQTRMDNSVATIGIKSEIEIKLQASFRIFKDTTIRPIINDYSIQVDLNRNVVSFKIKEPGQYTIEFRSDRTLHLFVNDYSAMDIDYKNEDWIVFEPGIHNKDNDSRINSNNEINVTSNSTIYICPNAFIEGRFLAYNQSNFKIFGCGYIDGQFFERNQITGSATIPIDFNYCNNIKLYDFSVIDPAGWCFNIYFTNNSEIKNCKVISSRSNGDGISIQSCQNILVEDCFVRSWDDSLVVKNYKNWSTKEMGYTDNIRFKNCLLWTDLAQSMEIGFETVGEHLENIYFEDITVLHNYHKPIFSIHNGNQAQIRNVNYKNIIVEDASMGNGDGKNYLLEFQNVYSTTWSDQYGSFPIGDIDGITMENIEVLTGKENPKLVISGLIDPRSNYSKEIHYIKNVKIKNFKLYGNYLEISNFETNYVEGLEVSHN